MRGTIDSNVGWTATNCKPNLHLTGTFCDRPEVPMPHARRAFRMPSGACGRRPQSSVRGRLETFGRIAVPETVEFWCRLRSYLAGKSRVLVQMKGVSLCKPLKIKDFPPENMLSYLLSLLQKSAPNERFVNGAGIASAPFKEGCVPRSTPEFGHRGCSSHRSRSCR